MKYAQYLKALESDAPPEWRGKFLGYKRLKKAIKQLRCACRHGCLELICMPIHVSVQVHS